MSLYKITFELNGIQYETECDFPEEIVTFQLEENNFSCDCNRSLLIKRAYPDFEEMECGEEIELISYELKQQKK